jgi:hypothetical protein
MFVACSGPDTPKQFRTDRGNGMAPWPRTIVAVPALFRIVIACAPVEPEKLIARERNPRYHCQDNPLDDRTRPCQQSGRLSYNHRWASQPSPFVRIDRMTRLLHHPKVITMLYKTITLRLLEERPALHEQLRQRRILLPTLDLLSKELKATHEALKAALSKASPDIEESQIASESMEIAVKELEDRLPSESLPEDSGPLSLDQAMDYLRRHSPSA